MSRCVFPAMIVAVLILAGCRGGCPGGAHDEVIDRVVERLVAEEGYREHVYTDSQGHATIGYGFNLDAGMDEPLARMVARYELERNVREFVQLWPAYDRQSYRVRVALADMSYQLGAEGLLAFHDMLAHLEAGKWKEARMAARDSEWFRETPDRARDVISSLR